MSRHRDALLSAAAALTEAAYSLSDEATVDKLLDIAHQIRGNTLMGSLPDRSAMSGLSSLLKDLNLQWAVIGGMAVAVHGQERETSDIDVVVSALPPQDKTMDSDYMSKFGFYRGRSRTGGHLVLDHKTGQCEILPAVEDHMKWAIQTATPQMVLGLTVPVVSPEALVVLKVKAMTQNPKRKPRDLPDVVSILLGNPSIDVAVVNEHLTSDEQVLLTSVVHMSDIGS